MIHLVLAQRCFLATVFAVAFFGKVRHISRFRQFTASIHKLAIIPERTARYAASVIVVGEGTATVLLILPFFPRAGLALAAALLAVFVGVVIRSVRGGIFAECRCFGGAGAIMSNAMIVRNLLLMACAIPGLVIDSASMVMRPIIDIPVVVCALGAAVAFVRYYDVAVRALLVRRRTSSAHQQG
ncbi:MauE/DoxX family redox-associated membrane protein [Actinoallomurus sp. CA-150999]|uniref:MauE/DoxX family redox-associated membrane protein n=1 Tax=Actinoallomurus sp. CA-150999 TaxID=3239887 RepID=UPI003D92084A